MNSARKSEVRDAPASKVLIVDDDRTARLFLKELLQAQGLEVIEAEDAESGLEAFRTMHPDLVLMDLDLPGMDGVAACSEIRSAPGSASVPVVVVSGHQDAGAINAAYAAGATDFVVKPVNPPLLANRVQALLSGASGAGPEPGKDSDLLATLPDRVFVVDRHGRVLEQAGTGGGAFDAGIVGENLTDAWPGPASEELIRLVKKGLKSRKPASCRLQEGTEEARRTCEARVIPQGLNRAMLILRDITAEAISESRIEQLGFYDALTGLPNRFHFLKQLEEQLTESRFRQRQLAVVLIDLLGLERRRETLGATSADKLLVEAAKRMKSGTRGSGHVLADGGEVALLGEHQFGVLLEDVEDPVAAQRAAERLGSLLKDPMDLKGQQIQLDVRVGVAMYPDDGGDMETLLQRAERSLMEYGLNLGSTDTMSTGMRRRLASLREDLLEEVRWGFENNQFELHYLPRCDLRSGRIEGVEALLRWQHPLRGQVPLSEFFVVIQDSGLIVPVGDWVLRTACEQLKAWRGKLGRELHISVNCAAQQFAQPDFVGSVVRALEETGIEAAAVELELTEAALMRNPEAVRAKLEELHELGVGLVVDDFGTGFTSLNNFSEMPLDALKIDRTFVRRLPGDSAAAAICGAIVDIAHRFGATAIAEGVESDRQVEALVEMGCDEIQGFLLTQPLPAAEMGEFLARDGQSEQAARSASPRSATA